MYVHFRELCVKGELKMYLYLDGYKHGFEFEGYAEEYDDVGNLDTWYQLCINKKRRQALFFKSDDASTDEFVVLDCIRKPNELIKILKSQKDITVKLFKAEGTTTDYIIVKGIYIDKISDCLDFFRNIQTTKKYTVLKTNG